MQAGITLTQDGLVDHSVGYGSLSVPALEREWDVLFFLAPQTESCSLAIEEDLGLVVVSTKALVPMVFVTDNPEVSTPEGIRVGSTRADIDVAYGAMVFSYGDTSVEGGKILLVDDLTGPVGAPATEDSRLYAFELDSTGQVARMRAGMAPWIAYIDYCSDDASRPEGTGWPLLSREVA